MKTQLEILRELHKETLDAANEVVDFEENRERFSDKTRELLRSQAYGRLKEVLLRSEEFFRTHSNWSNRIPLAGLGAFGGAAHQRRPSRAD